ncbi:circadian clock protein KaiB [Mucilaginibacter sp. PPCGB 2223]|uniref:circadian clock KaiB family protein n=1 Tax=Mucilaginibacter sp. PPCGB 2223 TaxID=1886027 RepID=UPI0008264772|nr:circadian clock KaiB family protein [Mucilaginibacter sp. PPCGB 2223]OCX51337.1 circadian clock protein KaiB [Mucilaginibacter sp. PPCGB 2223]
MDEQPVVPDNLKLGESGEKRYILRLFVTGASPNSIRAITNTKNICEKYLNGRYELEIIDVHQQPFIAASEDLIAIPMLMRKFPLPERRMIGDMSDTDKVLRGLELKKQEE